MPCSSKQVVVDRPERIVVFDLDDTLYLECDYVRSGFAAVDSWARANLRIQGLAATMDALFESGVRGRIFDEALLALGRSPDPPLIRRMVAVYRQHRPRIALAPDAQRLWPRRSRGTRFAIVTDGPLDSQRRKIRALGLIRHIDIALCTDRWGRAAWKPNPLAFHEIESFFRLPPKCFTYVADNVSKDFQAPRSLGWRTVRIRRVKQLTRRCAAHFYEADEIVTHLDGLLV